MGSERMTGSIARFYPDKGFGFVRVVGRDDVFVHAADLQDKGAGPLAPGVMVAFDLNETARGPRAINVEILD